MSRAPWRGLRLLRRRGCPPAAVTAPRPNLARNPPPKLSHRLPCHRKSDTHIASIELRPNDLASPRNSRVGLTTFLQISNEPAALARSLTTHVTERRANDARNREVVQCPKRLRLHPAG